MIFLQLIYFLGGSKATSNNGEGDSLKNRSKRKNTSPRRTTDITSTSCSTNATSTTCTSTSTCCEAEPAPAKPSKTQMSCESNVSEHLLEDTCNGCNVTSVSAPVSPVRRRDVTCGKPQVHLDGVQKRCCGGGEEVTSSTFCRNEISVMMDRLSNSLSSCRSCSPRYDPPPSLSP